MNLRSQTACNCIVQRHSTAQICGVKVCCNNAMQVLCECVRQCHYPAIQASFTVNKLVILNELPRQRMPSRGIYKVLYKCLVTLEHIILHAERNDKHLIQLTFSLLLLLHEMSFCKLGEFVGADRFGNCSFLTAQSTTTSAATGSTTTTVTWITMTTTNLQRTVVNQIVNQAIAST